MQTSDMRTFPSLFAEFTRSVNENKTQRNGGWTDASVGTIVTEFGILPVGL